MTGKEVPREVKRWLTGEREQRMAWRGLGSQLSPKPSPRRASRKNNSGLASSVCEISRTRATFPALAFQLAYRHPLFRRSYSAQGHSYTVNSNTELEQVPGTGTKRSWWVPVVWSPSGSIDKYIICAYVEEIIYKRMPQARSVPMKSALL